MLEDIVATRQTSGQMNVFASMFVCSSDARSSSSWKLGTLWCLDIARMGLGGS